MKVRIHPTLYIYLLSMLMLSSWQTCVGALVALFVHELGHYSVCCLIHESIENLELTPFGGVMIYRQDKSPSKGWKGFCAAGAGPAANYLLLAYISAHQPSMDLMRSIVLSCSAMLLINMLPALPLDGGRILFSLAYYIFPLTMLITFLTCMGIAAGIGFLLMAVYGFIAYGILNCSVLIVGGYLIYSAWQSREYLLQENLLVVIQEIGEKKPPIQKIKTYRIPSDVLLIQLLPYLERKNGCEFVFETDGQAYRMSERCLCRLLLDQPTLSVQEAFSKNTEERGIYTFYS